LNSFTADMLNRAMAQIHITQSIFASFERFYRANLINSVTGYKPAMLIGTINNEGLPNVAIFSSVVHLGADPALVGFIQRPVGVSGDTFRNINANGVYTINHIHEHFIENAHYTSARFEPDISEFDACKLTPNYIDGFNAPFVQESKIKFGLELIEVVPIRHNNTSLVIGAIKHILLDEECLEENGNINLNHVKDVCISGLENYHQVERLRSLPYASVKNLPSF
jgi:flavin reductase (DIM6/NTAB) family NADH-FMN oxidoreductase RutF